MCVLKRVNMSLFSAGEKLKKRMFAVLSTVQQHYTCHSVCHDFWCCSFLCEPIWKFWHELELLEEEGEGCNEIAFLGKGHFPDAAPKSGWTFACLLFAWLSITEALQHGVLVFIEKMFMWTAICSWFHHGSSLQLGVSQFRTLKQMPSGLHQLWLNGWTWILYCSAFFLSLQFQWGNRQDVCPRLAYVLVVVQQEL